MLRTIAVETQPNAICGAAHWLRGHLNFRCAIWWFRFSSFRCVVIDFIVIVNYELHRLNFQRVSFGRKLKHLISLLKNVMNLLGKYANPNWTGQTQMKTEEGGQQSKGERIVHTISQLVVFGVMEMWQWRNAIQISYYGHCLHLRSPNGQLECYKRSNMGSFRVSAI